MPKRKKTPNTPPARSPEDSSEMNDISSPSGDGGNDNLSVALGGDVVGSVSASTGAGPGEPADVMVTVRMAGWKRDEWNEAASLLGVSTGEFVRSCVDPVVEETLRCSHPVGMRQVYPWSETCLKCGKRLRG